MSATQYEQSSFDLGEVSPDFDWRSDLKVRSRSVRSARNCRPVQAGGLAGRPGSNRLYSAADGFVADISVEGVAYFLTFAATEVTIRRRSDRVVVGTLTGAPWTADLLGEMVVETWGKQAFVFHQDFATQILERADDGTWSRTAWAPVAGPGDTTRQPFYRFAARGVTLTPSALTGTGVNLTASADSFTADMVGLRLRLQNREVEITAYTSATVVVVTIKQALHKTTNLTLDSTDGFSVGEIVQGLDTGATAEVVEVTSSTVMKVLKQDFTEFYYEGTATDKREMVVGPNAKSRMKAAESAPVTAVGVLDWTEQALSDYRGWPATGTVHQNRLWMARMPLIPFGVIASEIDDFVSAEVGVGDSDAIFELLGDASAGAIRWLVSAEQLLIFTSERVYYIPTATPTGIEFVSIDGSPGASMCKPVTLSAGILYAETNGAELVGLFATGDIRRSWRTTSLSTLAPHLVKEPVSIAYVRPNADKPEAQAFICNADGSISVLTYNADEADAVPSLCPWDTDGSWISLASAEGECWALALRDGAYQVEAFAVDAPMDGVIDTAVLQGAATTETILSPSGTMAADVVYRCAEYANRTVSLVVDGAYVGETAVNASGDFGSTEGDDIEVGYLFAAECVPWPPMEPQDQQAIRRKRKIHHANARWRGRYIAIDGKLQPVYRAEDDMSLPPPLRDETIRVPVFGGWSDSPTVTYSHPYPGPFLLLGHSPEVVG